MKNTAQTTNAIKKFLKQTFAINAKVKSKSYSSGSSIRIEYTGGINPKYVEKALDGIEYGAYDGMQDLYEFKNNEFEIGGEKLTQFKYAFVTREISEEFYFDLAKLVSQTFNYSDIHKVETLADFEKNFNSNFAGVWTWHQLIRNMARNINLVTDKLSEIEILYVFSTNNFEIGFVYEFGGKAYSTEDLPENIRLSELKEELDRLDEVYAEYQAIEHSYPFNDPTYARNQFENHKKHIEKKYGAPLRKLRQSFWSKESKEMLKNFVHCY